jgi:4-amino-4-deoxy-L-arabinose transferase-like glycosyltransferase
MEASGTIAGLKISAVAPRRLLHVRTLLPILGVYLMLAFYGIDRQSLWEDEFFSLERIASPIPIWKDGHGFLYFALLDFWARLGTSELLLRSLSVLFGAAAVGLSYAVGIRLLGRKTAIIATALIATSPFLIWYSQEARYVTLMLAASLLAMYAFERAVTEVRFRWWIAVGGTTLLALFSFLSTVLLPLIQALYLAASPLRRPLLKRWMVCQIVVFAIFALWFVNGTHFFRAFREANSAGEQIISNTKIFPFSAEYNQVRPAVIPYTFFALSAGFSLGPSPRELHADRSDAPLLAHAPILLLLGILYGGLFCAGLWALRSRRDSAMLLALWIAVPVLGVFAIAKLLNIFYVVRYVAIVFPAYVMILACGIGSLRRLSLQIVVVAAVLAVHGAALANYHFNPRYAREDARAAAQFLTSRALSQDLILVVGTVSSLPHYYKGSSPLVPFVTPNGRPRSPAEQVSELSAGRDRLWLVQIRPWQSDRAGRVKAALDSAWTTVEHRRFAGVDVYGYERAQ